MRPFNYEEFLGEPVEPVFNPPGCPRPRYGKPINLFTAPVEFTEDPNAGDSDKVPETTYAWMAFGQLTEDDSYDDHVVTDTMTIHADDPLFPIVKELGAKPNDPRIEQMRRGFCERVLQCKGPIGDECWALGERAVDQVLRETLL
jgi:hypothetical protein